MLDVDSVRNCNVIPEEMITPSKENSRMDISNNQNSISFSQNNGLSKNSNSSMSVTTCRNQENIDKTDSSNLARISKEQDTLEDTSGVKALNILQLQSKLIDNRPRYTLATTSRMLKNIKIEEKDILDFKETIKSPNAKRCTKTSYMNRRNQLQNIFKTENSKTKTQLPKEQKFKNIRNLLAKRAKSRQSDRVYFEPDKHSLTEQKLIDNQREYSNMQYKSYYELLQRISTERRQMDEQYNNLLKSSEDFIAKNPILFYDTGIVTDPERILHLKSVVEAFRLDRKITQSEIDERKRKENS